MSSTSVVEILSQFFQDSDSAIVAVYLFGSLARGDDHPASDVDVGVLLKDKPAPKLEGLHLDLEGELERELGRPVQLVVLNLAPVDLCHRVLPDGLLLLDRDPSCRI